MGWSNLWNYLSQYDHHSTQHVSDVKPTLGAFSPALARRWATVSLLRQTRRQLMSPSYQIGLVIFHGIGRTILWLLQRSRNLASHFVQRPT